MQHIQKDFSHLKGKLAGFSDAQLDAHFTLYGGYVKKLNEIEEKLKEVDRALANYSYGEYSELKRREAVAFNGSYLHEMYFDNLGEGGTASEELSAAIIASFGSIEAWESDLKACGGSTPGWVITTYNMVDKTVHNYIMFEHHIGLPVQQKIIMAMDCWEHAFMIDYGIKKADYITAFLKNINWKVLNERFAV
mgnify:FL=1